MTREYGKERGQGGMEKEKRKKEGKRPARNTWGEGAERKGDRKAREREKGMTVFI